MLSVEEKKKHIRVETYKTEVTDTSVLYWIYPERQTHYYCYICSYNLAAFTPVTNTKSPLIRNNSRPPHSNFWTVEISLTCEARVMLGWDCRRLAWLCWGSCVKRFCACRRPGKRKGWFWFICTATTRTWHEVKQDSCQIIKIITNLRRKPLFLSLQRYFQTLDFSIQNLLVFSCSIYSDRQVQWSSLCHTAL